MTSTPDVSGQVEAATQRIRDLSEQLLAKAKENGQAWLDGYEKVLQNILEYEEKAAALTGQDWAKELATTHANFVRETSEVFFKAVSEQLKK